MNVTFRCRACDWHGTFRNRYIGRREMRHHHCRKLRRHLGDED